MKILFRKTLGIQNYEKPGIKMSYFSIKYYKNQRLLLCLVWQKHFYLWYSMISAMDLLPAEECIFMLDTFYLSQLQLQLFAYKKPQTGYRLALKQKLDFPVILRHWMKKNYKNHIKWKKKKISFISKKKQ